MICVFIKKNVLLRYVFCKYEAQNHTTRTQLKIGKNKDKRVPDKNKEVAAIKII